MKHIPRVARRADGSMNATVHVVDLIDEAARLVDDATALGHADGERNWPATASQTPTEAEISIRARAHHLLHSATRCFNAELTRAQHGVEAALRHHARVSSQLPQALRQAKQVFELHDAELETPLLEAARTAEAAQRRLRSEELRAGHRLEPQSAGAWPLMVVGLFVAVVLEAVLSSSLLADVHPGGYVGASVMAFVVASLSLACSFSTGRLVRAMVDRETPGGLVLAVALGFAGLAGLVLGHAVVGRLREVALSIDFETAMLRAVPDVMWNHAFPTEASAVMVSLIGLACGLAGGLLGYRRADARRAEREGDMARAAERSLDRFCEVRTAIEARDVDQRAVAVLDALDQRMVAATTTLADAVQAWEAHRSSLVGVQAQLADACRIAIEQYRARAVRVRSDPMPASWQQSDTIEPLEIPIIEPDRGVIDAARRVLADQDVQKTIASARQELDRFANDHAERRADHLAEIEKVIYLDHYRPGDEPTPQPTAAAPLFQIGELRRTAQA